MVKGWVVLGSILFFVQAPSYAVGYNTAPPEPVPTKMKRWEKEYGAWLTGWFEKYNQALSNELESFRNFWIKEFNQAAAYNKESLREPLRLLAKEQSGRERVQWQQLSEKLVERFNQRQETMLNAVAVTLDKNWPSSAMDDIDRAVSRDRWQNQDDDATFDKEIAQLKRKTSWEYVPIWTATLVPLNDIQLPTQHEGKAVTLQIRWGGLSLTDVHYGYTDITKALKLLQEGTADSELIIDRNGKLWFRDKELELRFVGERKAVYRNDTLTGTLYQSHYSYEPIEHPEVLEQTVKNILNEVLLRRRFEQSLRRIGG
ncbi:hypothetical protein K2X33_05975 [bacterium]|nr:hypothetical protein [bacterium]